MANCSDIFLEYNGIIRLTDARRKSLKKSRKELRKKIRKYFDEEKKDEIKPKFTGQGSLLMDTIINPIPRKETVDGEEKTYLYYDVDDGVYFIGDEDENTRKSIQTYHNWIYDAVKGHTNTDPIDKNTCIRVLFADGHNIDLPTYYKKGTIPELAHKTKGWIESDPKEFADWFIKQADKNGQLRNIVRYLKGWKDNREFKRSDKYFPSGLILTILASNNFRSHQREDIALKETLILIESSLSKTFECLRPTTPSGENLLEEYTHKDYFLDELRKFIADAKKAIEEKNQKKSCEYWQKHLGDRFPCSLAKDEDEDNSSMYSGLTGIIGTSKPYAQTK